MSVRAMLAASVLALVLALAGCGGRPATPPAGTLQERDLAAAGRTTVLFVDGSASFRRYAADYEPEVMAITETVAGRGGRVLACVVDGQPLTTARITSTDFSQVPVGGSDPAIRQRFNQAKALGLTRTLEHLVRRPSSVSGSGQLEALELAADTPALTAVIFWTDAIVNQLDGFSVARASDAQIERQVRRWAPRLAGLRGRTVVLVGVGRGTGHAGAVMRAKRLFAGLSAAAGFRLYWAQSLAQLRG